ncbi:MAG: aspartate carbamoyltransferase, partial [Ruminococcus sp.]
DAVASRYGLKCQNADKIALTKMDILSSMKEIPVITGYKRDGVIVTDFDPMDELDSYTSVVEMLPGWKCDISGCRTYEELPENAKAYIRILEQLLNHEIQFISVGARLGSVFNKRSLVMRHLIDPLDFTLEETTKVLDLADRIAESPEVYSHVADGKKIATLFTNQVPEPALSFESAMLSLGGKSLGFAGAGTVQCHKRRNGSRYCRVVSCYADIIAMRHPKEGAPLRASMYATVPVINAGDGGHNHPTQTLIDLMTIRQRKGHLDHLTVGFCGDLKFGRTVHSLVNSLVRHPENEFYFISPEELKIPDYVIEETLKPNHSFYKEVTSLEETLPKLDILYMTRVQKERFFNEEDYVRLKDTYILNREKLNLAQPDMPVLHPLPRVDEIVSDVDQDPRAAYFDQVQNGKYIRMALIMALLEIPDPLTGRTVL